MPLVLEPQSLLVPEPQSLLELAGLQVLLQIHRRNHQKEHQIEPALVHLEHLQSRHRMLVQGLARRKVPVQIQKALGQLRKEQAQHQRQPGLEQVLTQTQMAQGHQNP